MPGSESDAALFGCVGVNSAASVRARLLNASKAAGENFQAYVTRCAIEQFPFPLCRATAKSQENQGPSNEPGKVGVRSNAIEAGIQSF